MTAYGVSFCVVGDIYHDKEIGTTYRFFDVTLALAGTEADAFALDKERRKAVLLLCHQRGTAVLLLLTEQTQCF
jgi:hypothetical protein